MTSGTIFKIRNELRDNAIKHLQELSKEKFEHPYENFSNGKKQETLNLYFTDKFQKVSQGYRAKFFLEEKLSLYQYKSDSYEEVKKSTPIDMWIFTTENANNYVLVKDGLGTSKRFIQVLNSLLFNRIKKEELNDKSVFMYVNFKITNSNIDELHSKKIISGVAYLDSGKTVDTHIKGMKLNGKKNKDLRETEEYTHLGEISERYNRIKINPTPFRNKCSLHKSAYVSCYLVEEQFLSLIEFLIKNFELVGIIDKTEFDDILV